MKNTKKFYSYGVILSILVIIMIIIFLIYQKSDEEKSNKVVEILGEQSEENLNLEIASTSMDKTIEEIKEDTTQIEVNEKENINLNNNENLNSNQIAQVVKENSEETIKNEIINFSSPVEGEIMREYAKDKLVYSDTLKEWITHLGIDIKAQKTTVVKASAAGKIIAIKNDPRFGLSVLIEHKNGYSTMYSNLLTAEFVTVGEEVEQGETIGTVGNTATFEIMDEPHLHFEIIKDGVQIDPNMYL